MKELVIIGAGMAGVTAAQEARQLHSKEDLSITIITKENPPSYTRPQLTELLAGTIREGDVIFRDENWFKDRDIQLIYPAQATKIDVLEQKVHYSFQGSPKECHYNALILATGASAFAPFMPDSTSPAADAVFSLRTLEDAQNIRQHLALKRKKAAVLGGGLLGLEAALALKFTGVEEVHVLEVSGYLLNRQLNRTASEMLRLYLERQEGLVIHTGVHLDTNELKSCSVAEVLRPICNDGVETLLYSTGVRSRIHLAKEAGLACGKGIIINEETATSNPWIFAAGDCAEFQGITWAIIPSALEQGKKAAEFACWHLFSELQKAKPEAYQQTIPRTTITIGKREAVSTGKAVLSVEEENSGLWKNHELGSPLKRGQGKEGDLYVNLVENAETGRIVGALAFGPWGSSVPWLSKLKQMIGKTWQEIEGQQQGDIR
ncbi:MAG: FAD-dependent oxidoreductase [Treponema sp.]|nr:FAD-dependent oxidoreductase [Treponema sp.]MDY4673534.1 FAD-dependent oxidoreductase [Treponema sp.]